MKPASGRQLLAVNLILVVAIGVLLSRPSFPRWLTLEAYGRREQTPRLEAQQRLIREYAYRHQTEAHTLIVGDSVVKSCPWPVDRLTHDGTTTHALYYELQALLDARGIPYDRIIFWVGTWDMMQKRSVDTYVEDTVGLVDLAQAHVREVILLGPMPSATVRTTTIANRAHVMAVANAVQQLRARLPDITVVDMGEFREMAAHRSDTDALYLDTLHISRAGFDLLNDQFLHLMF